MHLFPISQLRKLRLRKTEYLAQAHVYNCSVQLSLELNGLFLYYHIGMDQNMSENVRKSLSALVKNCIR